MEDLCKQQTRINLFDKQRWAQEQLSNLLLPGPHTHFLVSLFHLLTLQAAPYCLHIPATLLVDGSAVRFLYTKQDGIVSCQVQPDLHLGLQSLARHLPPSPAPQLVLKCRQKPPCFLASLPLSLPSACLLQAYVHPRSLSSTLVRAHWKRGNSSTAYYLISKQVLRPASASQPRFKFVAGSTQTDLQFHISAKRADCTFVKRVKPYPEIDRSLAEVRRLLKRTLPAGKWVQEVVCDYVLDAKKVPVLLNCEGFIAETTQHIRVRTISPFLEHRVESDGESLGKSEPEREKCDFPRASTEVPKSLSLIKRIPVLSAASPSPESLYLSAVLTNEVSRFDQLRDRISVYRQEQQDSINFVRKYGGTEFWQPVLVRVAAVFREDRTLKRYYDHLNFEEGHMLLRGYERILEGNFNMYYKKSMTQIHTGKGISTAAFQAFVDNVAKALGEFAVTKQDCGVIVGRFRKMESCICPK